MSLSWGENGCPKQKCTYANSVSLVLSDLVVIRKMSLLLVPFLELTSFVSLFQGNQLFVGSCVFRHYFVVFTVGVFEYLWNGDWKYTALN